MNISRGFGGQEERFNYFKLGSTGWFGLNSCVFNRKGAHLTLGIHQGTRAMQACAKTASRQRWIRSDQAGFIISLTWQVQICHTELTHSLYYFSTAAVFWVSVQQDVTYFPLHTLLSYFHSQMANRTHTYVSTEMSTHACNMHTFCTMILNNTNVNTESCINMYLKYCMFYYYFHHYYIHYIEFINLKILYLFNINIVIQFQTVHYEKGNQKR